MSQGTPINKLGSNTMNDEDSRLVDSILYDLNFYTHILISVSL